VLDVNKNTRRAFAVLAAVALMGFGALTATVVAGGDDEPRLTAMPVVEAEATTTTTAAPVAIAPPAPVVVTVPGPVQVVHVPGPAVNVNNNVTAEAKIVNAPPPPPPPAPAPETPPAAPPCGPVAVTDYATARSGEQIVIRVMDNDYTTCPREPGDLYIINADVASTRGEVSVPGGVEMTYTAPDGFTGQEHFTYVITNGPDRFATGAVIVSVMAN
jgi:hypothetical protein